MRLSWKVHKAWVLRAPAARLMPAHAAPHMATQWGPPTTPMNKAVIAIEVCMDQMIFEKRARSISTCRFLSNTIAMARTRYQPASVT